MQNSKFKCHSKPQRPQQPQRPPPAAFNYAQRVGQTPKPKKNKKKKKKKLQKQHKKLQGIYELHGRKHLRSCMQSGKERPQTTPAIKHRKSKAEPKIKKNQNRIAGRGNQRKCRERKWNRNQKRSETKVKWQMFAPRAPRFGAG